MMLLTKELRKLLPKLRTTDKKPDHEKRIPVKFFTPTGAWTWYAVEFDGEDTFFGYVKSGLGDDCSEWGYFSLEELSTVKGHLGLGIERDLHWNPNTTVEEMMCGDAS